MCYLVLFLLIIYGTLEGSSVSGHGPYIHQAQMNRYGHIAPNMYTHPKLCLYPSNMYMPSNEDQAVASPHLSPSSPQALPPCSKSSDIRSRIFTKLFSMPGAIADSLLSGEIII
ncbi:uncharacterized protein [Battus philenor]|uniref:uncharacterized protein n=1 Tax=Battus philenor TaxID=42288 RepID=UPI0035D029BF